VEGNSGTTAMNFPVVLSVAYDQDVTVDYFTADGSGSALAGVDYLSVSGSLTFAAGQTNQTISVPVIGDQLSRASASAT